MKKMITMLTLVAMLTASMTSCGVINETIGGSESSRAQVAAGDNEQPLPEDSDVEKDEPADTEQPEEFVPEDDSVEPEESVSDADISEPAVSGHEQLVETIDPDYVFEQGYSFSELYEMGLANATGEGTGYALVMSDGGAGHIYYNVYSTNDGGASWSEHEFYDELSGRNSHFALDDGGIMVFSTASPRDEGYPIVTYLSFDGEGIQSVEIAEYLAQTVLDDDRLITDADDIEYYITYLYGYVFNIVITDENGQQLLDRDFDMQTALSYSQGNL